MHPTEPGACSNRTPIGFRNSGSASSASSVRTYVTCCAITSCTNSSWARGCSFTPRAPDAPDGTWRMQQADVDRVQEFRKCIECFLCQDVCHVLRDHQLHDQFVGPRLLVHAAQLEMHPLDILDRTEELKESHGIGYCNITKCCTKVCPEHITITDNAIIPLKERVVDKHFDPLGKLVRLVRGRRRNGGGGTRDAGSGRREAGRGEETL